MSVSRVEEGVGEDCLNVAWQGRGRVTWEKR